MNFYKTVRKLTTVPVIATIFMVIMLIFRSTVFSGIIQWLYSVFFIGLMPLLAYPLQRFFPHFKDAGRNGQRTLAMIFSVAGYVICCVLGLIFSASPGLWVIYLQYLLCIVILVVFDRIFHFKASGHACGVIGPILLSIYFGLYPAAIVGVPIAVLTVIASLKTKRHTPLQLAVGGAVPFFVIAVLILIFGTY